MSDEKPREIYYAKANDLIAQSNEQKRLFRESGVLMSGDAAGLNSTIYLLAAGLFAIASALEWPTSE